MELTVYISRPISADNLGGQLGAGVRQVLIDGTVRPVGGIGGQIQEDHVALMLYTIAGWDVDWVSINQNNDVVIQVETDLSLSQVNSEVKRILSPYMTWTSGPRSKETNVPLQAPSVAGISTFTFNWEGVTNGVPNTSLSAQHANFNSALVSTFPKLLYTVPYSSFTDGRIGITSRLYAIGESKLSPSETKARLIQMAQAAGFQGNTSSVKFTQDTNQALADGTARLPDPGSTVTMPPGSDLYNTTSAGLGSVAKFFGITSDQLITYGIIGLGALVVVKLVRD